jgi:hypothetical protein
MYSSSLPGPEKIRALDGGAEIGSGLAVKHEPSYPLRPATGTSAKAVPERGTEQCPLFWVYRLAAQLRKPDAKICAFGKFSDHAESDDHWHTLTMSGEITFLGRFDYRNDGRRFGIKREDRFAHVYVIGKTGTGKSTLLEGMALQDLANGNGFALIDPLGDLAERVASHFPQSRRSDLIYLNAADLRQEWGYNPFAACRAAVHRACGFRAHGSTQKDVA